MSFEEFRELCLFPAIALGLLDISIAVLGVITLTEWQISALWKSIFVMLFMASGVVCGKYYLLYEMDSWGLNRAKREAKSSALLGTAFSLVSTTLPELAKMLCVDANDRKWAVFAAYITIGVILWASVSYYRCVLEYIDELNEKKKEQRKKKRNSTE